MDAKRPQQRRQRLFVLLGQKFRRRHERSLFPVFDCTEAGCCRNHRLAAANVALHEPIHHMAGGQIMQDLFDHAVLRARQPEGKRAEKRVHAAGFIRCGVQFRSRRAQDGQACRENKKFLKNEPFPRPLQRVPAFRRVDGGICLRYAAEAVLRPHRLRQKFRQSACCRKRLLDTGAERPVGKPRCERVHGQ